MHTISKYLVKGGRRRRLRVWGFDVRRHVPKIHAHESLQSNITTLYVLAEREGGGFLVLKFLREREIPRVMLICRLILET